MAVKVYVPQFVFETDQTQGEVRVLVVGTINKGVGLEATLNVSNCGVVKPEPPKSN